MSHRDDDEKDGGPLDFSQYIPNWRGTDDDDDSGDEELFYEEGAFDKFDPEEVLYQIDERNIIRVRHFRDALLELSQERGTNGPFTLDDVTLKIQSLLAEDRILSLIDQGLIAIVDGKICATELGKRKALEMLNRLPRK